MEPNAVRGRPRLLLVATSAELYGSDRTLLSALPELVEAFDVTVAFPFPGPAVEAASAAGATTLVLPDYAFRTRVLQPGAVVPWLRRYARALQALHREHRRRPFALVYSNTINSGAGPFLRLWWRIPNLLHVHECPDQRAGQLRAVLAVARWTSDAVVFNSEFTRQRVGAYDRALAARGRVVHNGIEPPAPRPEPAARRGLRISVPARIHPKKGHAVVLDAASWARRQGRRWVLDLYGDALPEHEHLRRELLTKVDAEGLEAAVTWHGFVHDADRMYRDADVCVVASVVPEEFSLVCLEAQARGVPVVATGPGGPSEVLEDGVTGMIVPPGDPCALAAALASLEDDPGRRGAMGQAARRRAAHEFTRAAFGEAVRECCELAIRRGTGGRRVTRP